MSPEKYSIPCVPKNTLVETSNMEQLNPNVASQIVKSGKSEDKIVDGEKSYDEDKVVSRKSPCERTSSHSDLSIFEYDTDVEKNRSKRKKCFKKRSSKSPGVKQTNLGNFIVMRSKSDIKNEGKAKNANEKIECAKKIQVDDKLDTSKSEAPEDVRVETQPTLQTVESPAMNSKIHTSSSLHEDNLIKISMREQSNKKIGDELMDAEVENKNEKSKNATGQSFFQGSHSENSGKATKQSSKRGSKLISDEDSSEEENLNLRKRSQCEELKLSSDLNSSDSDTEKIRSKKKRHYRKNNLSGVKQTELGKFFVRKSKLSGKKMEKLCSAEYDEGNFENVINHDTMKTNLDSSANEEASGYVSIAQRSPETVSDFVKCAQSLPTSTSRDTQSEGSDACPKNCSDSSLNLRRSVRAGRKKNNYERMVNQFDEGIGDMTDTDYIDFRAKSKSFLKKKIKSKASERKSMKIKSDPVKKISYSENSIVCDTAEVECIGITPENRSLTEAKSKEELEFDSDLNIQKRNLMFTLHQTLHRHLRFHQLKIIN